MLFVVLVLVSLLTGCGEETTPAARSDIAAIKSCLERRVYVWEYLPSEQSRLGIEPLETPVLNATVGLTSTGRQTGETIEPVFFARAADDQEVRRLIRDLRDGGYAGIRRRDMVVIWGAVRLSTKARGLVRSCV